MDFGRGVVTVRTVLISRADGGGWYFGEPKTRRSKRSVPFPQAVMDALREHKHKQDEWKKRAGDSYNDHGLVFATNSGGLLTREICATHFTGACWRLDCLPTFDFMTCATLARPYF